MSDNATNEINTLGFATAKELQENFRQVEEIMKGFAKSYENMQLDPMNLSKAYTEWMQAISSNPQKLLEANMEYWQKSMELTQQTMMAMMGQKPDKVVEPEKGDRRFKHEDWEENPAFDIMKQSYLLTSQWMRNLVTDVEGLDDRTSERVKFFTERYLDALSPTNFAATNPAVLEKIKETKGANLVHGLKNMLEDLEEGEGELRIRMTDKEAFELGENIAVTPGKVVFQNSMFQLVKYAPTTDKVLKRPLLIVPPWINKFYILDLQPKNSLLKWLVDQGHTVFIMSWVNPDETYADTGFEDYVNKGVLTALDAVEYDTGENAINAIGYCIGGTLLTSTLSYMKRVGDDRIKSVTFFTTMLDFKEPGELGIFIDEEQVQGIEASMQQKGGYLDGSKMAGTFNLLRANDLIWSFYVNNYLLGNDPRPFDLLYWNSDSTRMPAKMHSWYLRNMYLENNLCQAGKISINGEPVDVGSLDLPVCFVSAIDDHIAPWKATYSGAQLFSGDTRFILGGSGHIAGIVNPPAANKYGYRVTDDLSENAEQWLANASVNEGSWWPEWNKWIYQLDDTMVEARVPGEGQLAAIEDAPGTYVRVRATEPTPIVPATELPSDLGAAASKAAATPTTTATKSTAKKASTSSRAKSTSTASKSSSTGNSTTKKSTTTRAKAGAAGATSTASKSTSTRKTATSKAKSTTGTSASTSQAETSKSEAKPKPSTATKTPTDAAKKQETGDAKPSTSPSDSTTASNSDESKDD